MEYRVDGWPFRLTISRMVLFVAVAGLLIGLATGPIRSRRQEYLKIADNFARSGEEYLRNSAGIPSGLRDDMIRIGTWHRVQSRHYEQAASLFWITPPPVVMFPPSGWTVTEESEAPVPRPARADEPNVRTPERRENEEG